VIVTSDEGGNAIRLVGSICVYVCYKKTASDGDRYDGYPAGMLSRVIGIPAGTDNIKQDSRRNEAEFNVGLMLQFCTFSGKTESIFQI